MHRFRNVCQHIFNPLHLFCRLRQMGCPVAGARALSRAYERAVYRFILHRA